MLDRAHRISSDWPYFSEECDRLETREFVDSKVANQHHIPSTYVTTPTIRVIIPFKDQTSANVVKNRLTDLGLKIKAPIQPVFISEKLREALKLEQSSQPPTIEFYIIREKFSLVKQI